MYICIGSDVFNLSVMKRISMLTNVLWISTVFAFSSDSGGAELFPEIKGWNLTPNERMYVPSDLWDLIDGAADTYLSYNFLDLHLADYNNEEGINVRVELYRQSTFDNTFGIYTTERSPDYHFIQIGSEGYLEEGALNFLCGYYYIKVTTNNQGDDAQNSLIEIAGNVEKHLKQENNWPDIFQMFPPGLIPYSEHYIAENFLGFEFLHSAFTAEYNKEGVDFQVFIIRTDSPEGVHEMLGEYLKFTKQDAAVTDGLFKIHDPYNGDIDVILKGNILAGIVNCDDESVLKEYIGLLEGKL
jgi:hypothetical protein